MESEIIKVEQAEILQAINKAEVDMQISTAKQYPRNLARVLEQIQTYATLDAEIAEDCFYALRRESRDGSSSLIEGISVRLAEIIAGAWGNLRVQTRVIGNDGRTVTVQGVCHDLETNVAVSIEVKRGIINKYGKTYSADMQNVTTMAASAIAFRNAVLKVVPKAVTKKVVDEIKRVAMGQTNDLESRRQRMISWFNNVGVSTQNILDYCGVKTIAEIDMNKVFELRGLANAIKEGTTSVQETFKASVSETSQNTANKAMEMAADAMAKSKAPK